MRLAIQEISYNDHYLNYQDGWGIFCTGPTDNTRHPFQLERIDDSRVFINDMEAIQYVCQKVMETGNITNNYIRALKFLQKHSPDEINVTFLNVIGREALDQLINKLNTFA